MSSNILHFANVQKSNTRKKWALSHTTLVNLDTFISTKSLSDLSLLLCFCYKIDLRQSSILMPNSLFKQLHMVQPHQCVYFSTETCQSVADSGGVRRVQMHPPLVASIIYFCAHNLTSP